MKVFSSSYIMYVRIQELSGRGMGSRSERQVAFKDTAFGK